jgi:molecular chaperone GrpE (heat shock protein)
MNDEEKKNVDEDNPSDDDSGMSIEDMGLPLEEVENHDPVLENTDDDEGLASDVLDRSDDIDELMPLRISDDDDLEDGILLDTSTTLAPDEIKPEEAEAIPLSDLVTEEQDVSSPQDDATTPPSSEEDPATSLNREALGPIQTALSELQDSFNAKIKYDEHKEKIIDALHHELQEYKNDIVKKLLQSMIMDVIKVIDDVRKMAAHFRMRPATDIDSGKILKYLETVPVDLEDVVGLHGVKPFICEGSLFDASRQRVTKKVKTNDPDKDKTIAKSLRPGYEWDGQVIRPEMVATYHYVDENTETEMRSSDE